MRNPDDITERPLDERTAFRRIRAFLAARATDTPGLGWDVRMWDGAWHTGAGPEVDARRRTRMRTFETADGRIAAALLSQGNEEIHPQVHPAFLHLESSLLARGEEITQAAGETSVKVLCWEQDEARARTLTDLGYARSEDAAHLYRMSLDGHVAPEAQLSPGYRLRPTRDDDADHRAVADLLNAAFDRTRHTANEVRALQEHAPSFRRDLDLVAETADGAVAAYAAVCWDHDNHRGIFEPICTHPDHRRRCLQRALMTEGMRRAQALGARSLDVSTGDAEPANALYPAVGFTERHRGWFWTKSLA